MKRPIYVVIEIDRKKQSYDVVTAYTKEKSAIACVHKKNKNLRPFPNFFYLQMELIGNFKEGNL